MITLDEINTPEAEYLKAGVNAVPGRLLQSLEKVQSWQYESEWGIPLLDAAYQAEYLPYPIIRWGKYKQTHNLPGTYHFYTHDYKFEALWRNPEKLVATGCSTAVEINYSTFNDQPKAEALFDIYKKRWIARYWQDFGIKIFVDLFVDGKFAELNLLGVPKGWRAYATRGSGQDTDYLISDFKLAQEHAGTNDILFLVYGGTKGIKSFCDHRGWLWLPEDVRAERGKTMD